MPNKYTDDTPQCKAKSKTTGNRCTASSMRGQFVCYHHGGASKAARAAGERRMKVKQYEKNAKAVLASQALEPVQDPVLELGKLAAEVRAMTSALGERVNALNEVDVFDLKNAPHIQATVQLYENSLDRTHRLLDSMVKNGYAERQTKVAEAEAAVLFGVVMSVLQRLDLPPERVKQARTMIAAELEVLG